MSFMISNQPFFYHRTKYAQYDPTAQHEIIPYTAALKTLFFVIVFRPSTQRIAMQGVNPRAYVDLAVLKTGCIKKTQ
jgi:hypothetical protein